MGKWILLLFSFTIALIIVPPVLFFYCSIHVAIGDAKDEEGFAYLPWPARIFALWAKELPGTYYRLINAS